VAREGLQQAEKEVDVATSYLYPQITATGSHVQQKELSSSLSTPEEYELLTLSVDQHVYQLGKVWAGRRMAQYHLQGSRLSYERTIREILFQVATAYYNVLLGRRAIGIAESALARATKQLERAQAQFEVGVLTQTNVLRAEVQVAQANEQLERAENQYRVAKEVLALEIGIEEIAGQIAEPSPGIFPRESLAVLINTALEERNDLKTMEINIQTAQERVQWERADFFPKVFLHGEFQRTSDEDLFYDNDDNWSASVNLSYPLFTGGRNRADLSGAKSELRQAEALLARFRKAIRTEVRRVYLDLQTQRKVLEQNRVQVRSAKKNYEQVTAQFEEGLATSVDQVDAFTALNQAENLLANAHYSYQLDLIKLKLATGTLHVGGRR
jgi:outer membrane protein